MKLVVLIPKPRKGNGLYPIIAITENWKPNPNEYVSEGMTQNGTTMDFCPDDYNAYVWDAQTIFDKIVKSLWYSSQLLRF